MVEVVGSVVDGAVVVVDGFETVVLTCAGADVLDEFSVDDDGSAVTASVAGELEIHAGATRGRTPINIVTTMDDRQQPSRRREVDTPDPKVLARSAEVSDGKLTVNLDSSRSMLAHSLIIAGLVGEQRPGE